ncbi:hypothetical protein DXV75_12335 [Alteromonas aestuariivivens]|uniref:Uncharacterized protein n=2 Tax=Alteromonas aestuariivivens TaxID=1938339 RepID=A0A3D8M5B8_9ALTE|nr:hypothetical protein DXV75_12335 [Alteromonas aestuariivivens]
MLFLTGIMLVVVGLLDVLIRIDSLRTACYLVGGLILYKVGHVILRQCATLRTRPARRKQLFS